MVTPIAELSKSLLLLSFLKRKCQSVKVSIVPPVFSAFAIRFRHGSCVLLLFFLKRKCQSVKVSKCQQCHLCFLHLRSAFGMAHVFFFSFFEAKVSKCQSVKVSIVPSVYFVFVLWFLFRHSFHLFFFSFSFSFLFYSLYTELCACFPIIYSIYYYYI